MLREHFQLSSSHYYHVGTEGLQKLIKSRVINASYVSFLPRYFSFLRWHFCYIIIPLQNKGNEDIKIPDIQRDDEGKESVWEHW